MSLSSISPTRTSGRISGTTKHAEVGSGIGCLFSGRGPSTIRGFVVAVVVDAIDRVARRTAAHVGQKVIERKSPSLAYGNAPSAVILIPDVARVLASSLHALPNLVFGRRFTAGRFAVFPRGYSRFCAGAANASTAFSAASPKPASLGRNRITAVAHADPPWTVGRLVCRSRHNGQSLKSPSNKALDNHARFYHEVE
jgi:hypothetical protein